MTTDLILGTAGHIDHGKTSLIRALTGVDTDRLPEEKKRGITIDLGFAELTVGPYRMGIVDVPGHERFVRNMLAGATGMDLALLVVAADDSIKPQTREHLDILRLLDLRCGTIAITKCDLVEPDWISLVEEEVRDLVADTFLAEAPIVRTSATSGTGIDALRAELEQAAEQATAARERTVSPAPFRMAIDRTFTVAGHGTVVTGSVSSGVVRLGDEAVIEPGALPARIRGLQNHDRAVEEVHRGQRAAINLAGIHHEQIRRGHELTSKGHLRPSRRMVARLRAVDSLAKPIKNRSRVRVHVGTAELLATLVLLDTDQIAAGQEAFGQLFLSGEAVTTWNQPFVIRSESPVQTIGGGQVLVPQADRLPRQDSPTLQQLAKLTEDDLLQRAAAALYFAGLHHWQPSDLARTAGIEQTESVVAKLASAGILVEAKLSPTRTLQFHQKCLEQLTERIAKTLEKFHDRHPLRLAIDRVQLRQGFDYLDDAVFELALTAMRQTGQIRGTPAGYALKGHGPKLSQNEHKLLAKLVDDYRQCGLESPSVKEIQQQVTKNQSSVPQLISLAAANGDLVQITDQYFVHHEVNELCQQKLTQSFAEGGLTVSQIREILDTSRKYAVPYCEFLDRSGFTRRVGDRRVLAGPPAEPT
jgi:selenocysteine-specific elongation factor